MSLAILRCLLLLVVWQLSASAWAAEADCAPSDCTTVGEWQFGVALGLGVRSNPLIDSSDIPLVVVPKFSYYGERFFIDDLELGYTLLDRPLVMVNAITTVGYDSVYFYRWDPGNIFVEVTGITGEREVMSVGLDGLHHHRMAILAGLEGSGALHSFEWQVQLLRDISGVHEGREAHLGLGFGLPLNSWQLKSSLGFTWKSQALVDYYYGIRANEVRAGRALYVGKATFNPFVKLALTRQLNEFWQFNASGQYEQLGAGMRDSPLVEDNHVITAFIGANYQF